MNITNLENFPKAPRGLRHRAYTYYVVSFTNPNGRRQYLTKTFNGSVSSSSAIEFPNKKAAKYWMHYWMNRTTTYAKPNILKVRGIPLADRQIAELMAL